MDFQNPPAFTLGGSNTDHHQDTVPSKPRSQRHPEEPDDEPQDRASQDDRRRKEQSDAREYHLPPEMREPPDTPQPWSKTAIIALIINTCAFLISFIPLVNIMAAIIAVPGLIAAIVALIITRDAGSRRGKPMAIIAVILALAALILTGVLWFIIQPAVSVPFAH